MNGILDKISGFLWEKTSRFIIPLYSLLFGIVSIIIFAKKFKIFNINEYVNTIKSIFDFSFINSILKIISLVVNIGNEIYKNYFFIIAGFCFIIFIISVLLYSISGKIDWLNKKSDFENFIINHKEGRYSGFSPLVGSKKVIEFFINFCTKFFCYYFIFSFLINQNGIHLFDSNNFTIIDILFILNFLCFIFFVFKYIFYFNNPVGIIYYQSLISYYNDKGDFPLDVVYESSAIEDYDKNIVSYQILKDYDTFKNKTIYLLCKKVGTKQGNLNFVKNTLLLKDMSTSLDEIKLCFYNYTDEKI